MRALVLSLVVLPTALALAGCKPAATPESATPDAAATAPAPVEALPAAAEPVPVEPEAIASSEFDPESVPESTATLPPFPFFASLEGTKSAVADKDKHVAFDRQYFLAGSKAIPVEGRIFRDRFHLDGGERKYSALEFLRNYENAVLALGGKKINDGPYTLAIIEAAGGRNAMEKPNYAASMIPSYQHDSYLIRQGGKEYWIELSVGSYPAHGYVVVLEREAMKQSLGFLDASALKQAIDQDGKVALHINFDTDKASLRPDAQPVLDEIGKLLAGDPALKLSIEGHTDNSGTPARNQELSTARARSVLGALVGLGIDPARLSSKGYGQDKPVADNGSDEGRAKNRRVELVKVD